MALFDDQGKVVARRRIDTSVGGFTEVLAANAEHGGGPDETPVAIERGNRSHCSSTAV